MAISELPLRVTRGACPHDCPDTFAWTGVADLGEGGGFHSALVEVERVR